MFSGCSPLWRERAAEVTSPHRSVDRFWQCRCDCIPRETLDRDRHKHGAAIVSVVKTNGPASPKLFGDHFVPGLFHLDGSSHSSSDVAGISVTGSPISTVPSGRTPAIGKPSCVSASLKLTAHSPWSDDRPDATGTPAGGGLKTFVARQRNFYWPRILYLERSQWMTLTTSPVAADGAARG